MSDDKKGFDYSFSNKAVQERLEAGRREMAGVHEDVDKKKKQEPDPEPVQHSEEQASIGTVKKKPGDPYGPDKPVSGKLDTQLFPAEWKKNPKYHE